MGRQVYEIVLIRGVDLVEGDVFRRCGTARWLEVTGTYVGQGSLPVAVQYEDVPGGSLAWHPEPLELVELAQPVPSDDPPAASVEADPAWMDVQR